MKKISAAVAAASLILLQAACGGGGAAAPTQAQPPQASPTPAPLGPVDPALVGRWTGTVNGTLGAESMTLVLNSDSTAPFEGSGRYCAVNGNWGVAGTEVTVTGRDCTSTLVTLVAPLSATILDGQWTASSGAHGTFKVSKQ
jgi:hypothetical protein